MRRKSNIYSIFGQIETVVAQAMVDEKKLYRIEFDDIPATERFNADGVRASFAVVMPSEHEPEYNRRVRELYA